MKLEAYKGPFKYYVIKRLGGWGEANDYDWLQGGWLGSAVWLHNHTIKVFLLSSMPSNFSWISVSKYAL